jgi:hypothetical protein
MSSPYPPNSLLKSRENLQAICKNPHEIMKYETFDKFLFVLWTNIRRSPPKSLKYIINLYDHKYLAGYQNMFTEAIILELIEILLQKCDRHFPSNKIDIVLDLISIHG